jgi:hypothetical protein
LVEFSDRVAKIFCEIAALRPGLPPIASVFIDRLARPQELRGGPSYSCGKM